MITREMYTHNDKKYIDIDGIRVKVPWRYNRVMCKVHGFVPLQDLRPGDLIECSIIKRFDVPILDEVFNVDTNRTHSQRDS